MNPSPVCDIMAPLQSFIICLPPPAAVRWEESAEGEVML